MNYNDWKILFDKDFWSKKEISYQYVHFTNAMLIVYVSKYLLCDNWKIMLLGLLVGLVVEIKQVIDGNWKPEDMIRDLLFWTFGGIFGYYA